MQHNTTKHKAFDRVGILVSTSFAAGIHVKVMSDRLGHATTSFTQDVYMHAIPELEQDAADQIADIVFGSRNEAPEGEGQDDCQTGDAEPSSASLE